MKKIEGYNPIERENAIRLNANESSMGVDKELLSFVLEEYKEIDFNRYPENNNSILIDAYKKYAGVEDYNLMACRGSDEALSIIIGAYIGKGDKLLTLSKDFTMYDFYVNLYGGEIIKLKCNDDGSYSIYDFIEMSKRENPKVIVFSNPNNPTGFAIRNEEIKIMLNELKDTIIVVDEAYFEFFKESMVDEIDNYSNLIVTRTLSKAFGAASLRIGFLIANKDRVDSLYKYKIPYNISTMSQVLGRSIIENPDKMWKCVDETLVERDRVYEELLEISKKIDGRIKFYKSNANFIYGEGKDKKIFIDALEREDILIRDFNNEAFRITIGCREENNLLIDVIRESLYKEFRDE